jgi:hypothetical protein
VWRSAKDVPRSEGGRPLAHIAVNGHGSYPTAGTIPRIFFAANDQTSNQGAVWDPVCAKLESLHIWNDFLPILGVAKFQETLQCFFRLMERSCFCTFGKKGTFCVLWSDVVMHVGRSTV